MEIDTKKPAVDLTDMALGIIILGIVVTIGATVLLNVRDISLTDATTTAVSQTITGSNTTATELSTAWFNTISAVANATNGQVVTSGNYSTTINSAGKGLFLVVGSQFNGASLQVNYSTYDTSSRPDWTLANSAALGLGEYGNWFDIIVIVGVAAIILSLIFVAFGRGNGGNEGGVAY